MYLKQKMPSLLPPVNFTAIIQVRKLADNITKQWNQIKNINELHY
jgi:hypothetical protein